MGSFLIGHMEVRYSLLYYVLLMILMIIIRLQIFVIGMMLVMNIRMEKVACCHCGGSHIASQKEWR